MNKYYEHLELELLLTNRAWKAYHTAKTTGTTAHDRMVLRNDAYRAQHSFERYCRLMIEASLMTESLMTSLYEMVRVNRVGGISV